MMDFLNKTKQELENIDRNELNKFTQEEFLSYYQANKKLGNYYLFDGLTESEAYIKEKLSDEYIPMKFYGNFTKMLRNNEGLWEIGQGLGLVPTFKEYPKAVDETEFKKLMTTLGVSTEIIEEFLEYKPDYTNF